MKPNEVQVLVSSLLHRADSLEARALAHECALQCLLAHWGQPKSTLKAALEAASLKWDASYETDLPPKPSRQKWREAIDELIAQLG